MPLSCRILDFGIATLVSEARTHFTGAIGTPLFMAPEQMTAGTAIAPATDVWALGLMVFWMLTGRTYWETGNVQEATPMMLLNEVSSRPIVAASQRAAQLGVSDMLPASFDAWFERAVVRAIDARFKNAREARSALEPLLEAARMAKEALELDPDVVDVRVMLAERALEQHDVKEALSQASRAAGVEPRHTAALLCLADALAMSGNKVEALDAYRKALAAWKQHGHQGAPEDRLALVEGAIANDQLPPPRTPPPGAPTAATDSAPTAPRSRPSPDNFSNLGL